VGGIKEKVLAAHRAGLKTVILPKRNEKDLDELPDEVRKEMNFVLAEQVMEVFSAALSEQRPPAPGGNGNRAEKMGGSRARALRAAKKHA